MQRILAASTLANIITDIRRRHDGIDTAKMVQFIMYDLVEWCNQTSRAPPGSEIGGIMTVPDSTHGQIPSGYMHARCVANAVMSLATDALGDMDWSIIPSLNPHQLTAYIGGKISAADESCTHAEPLEPMGHDEQLFTI